MRSKSIMFGAVMILLLVACASAPVKYVGGILTTQAGMTLYHYAKDTANTGKSECNGSCAKNWPPFLASDGDKTGGFWSIITRDDGSKQWAYKGKPVYLWVKDQKPGDRTGDGVANAWRVIEEEVPTRPTY